jgi:hypothetical protein
MSNSAHTANARTIIITEGGSVIFRRDNNSKAHSKNLEIDIVNAIEELEKDKRLDMNKVMILLKVKMNKFGIRDMIEVIDHKDEYLETFKLDKEE